MDSENHATRCRREEERCRILNRLATERRALEIVKLEVPEVRSKPKCLASADLGPNTDEETPNARAAMTSATAPDAITDFVLVNRSDFICSSFFAAMGKTTEEPRTPRRLKPFADLTRRLAGPRGSTPWPGRPTGSSVDDVSGFTHALTGTRPLAASVTTGASPSQADWSTVGVFTRVSTTDTSCESPF